MVVVPGLTAVAIPDVDPIVATPALLLVQMPAPNGSLSSVDCPSHKLNVPVMSGIANDATLNTSAASSSVIRLIINFADLFRGSEFFADV